MAHTKGPWVLILRGACPYQITGAEGQLVTRWGAFARPTSNESLANARLMKAAPAMYEALKECLALFGDTPEEQDAYAARCVTSCDAKFIRSARAAIAAATGGEK